MKRLKRMKALQETYKMWSELAKTGEGKPKTDYVYSCACCEYVVQKIYGKNWRELSMFANNERLPNMDCKTTNMRMRNISCKDLCPMKTHWPEGCTKVPADFYRWNVAHLPDTRKIIAQGIADGAKKILLGEI